jgi:flagellar assembly protein FliH
MSTIIKAAAPIRTLDGASYNFDDMALKANQYLDQVRAQAADILRQAEVKAQAICKRAEEDGRQAALRAVEKVLDEKVGRQMATLLPALDQAVAGVVEARQAWLRHWEQTAVRVAAAIAGRVVRREVRECPEITLALVTEALELAAGSPEIKVHLHPSDHAALGQQVQALTSRLARVGEAQVVADPQITAGSCRVNTRFGVIDQQFEAQLARIEQELTA